MTSTSDGELTRVGTLGVENVGGPLVRTLQLQNRQVLGGGNSTADTTADARTAIGIDETGSFCSWRSGSESRYIR